MLTSLDNDRNSLICNSDKPFSAKRSTSNRESMFECVQTSSQKFFRVQKVE